MQPFGVPFFQSSSFSNQSTQFGLNSTQQQQQQVGVGGGTSSFGVQTQPNFTNPQTSFGCPPIDYQTQTASTSSSLSMGLSTTPTTRMTDGRTLMSNYGGGIIGGPLASINPSAQSNVQFQSTQMSIGSQTQTYPQIQTSPSFQPSTTIQQPISPTYPSYQHQQQQPYYSLQPTFQQSQQTYQPTQPTFQHLPVVSVSESEKQYQAYQILTKPKSDQITTDQPSLRLVSSPIPQPTIYPSPTITQPSTIQSQPKQINQIITNPQTSTQSHQPIESNQTQPNKLSSAATSYLLSTKPNSINSLSQQPQTYSIKPPYSQPIKQSSKQSAPYDLPSTPSNQPINPSPNPIDLSEPNYPPPPPPTINQPPTIGHSTLHNSIYSPPPSSSSPIIRSQSSQPKPISIPSTLPERIYFSPFLFIDGFSFD
jgi:hypothetical protein